MNLKRLLLRPAARLAATHAYLTLRAFVNSHRRTREVQDRLLASLIARARETAFGRDHGLAAVRTYDEFVKAVPLGNYDTLEPYMQRVLAGETTALLPADQPVLMFSRTSGTTGEPKHIPVTPAFAAHLKRTFSVFGYKALSDHKEVWLRPILTITSPTREVDSPTGLPCGAISGLLNDKQIRLVRRLYTVPSQVKTIGHPVAKYYAALRCSIPRDVSFITTANPSSTIQLIETGQQHVERLIRDIADGTLTPPEPIDPATAASLRFRPNRKLARRLEEGLRRDGQLLPRHFWNVAFLANWTGGTLKLYLPRLRELFDNIPIRDIGLVASEGRFSIPLADGTPAGVAEITANVLEFIPADQHDKPDPTALRPDEVDIGGEYFLVVTNHAGLWRYNLDDRIRVVDRLGQSPVFEFLCRGLHTANITGEKITEHQVVEAMKSASAATGHRVDRFIMQGHFDSPPYYELRAEAVDGELLSLVGAVDQALGRLNIEYAAKRSSGRLGPIQAVILPTGTLERIEIETIRSRLGRSEQYKHQYLLTDVLTDSPSSPANA